MLLGTLLGRTLLGRPTRLLALGGLVLVALLYWQPIRSYVHTREVLSERQAELASLRAEKRQLQQRLDAIDSRDTLIREARRLGLVKPGEQLFIVRGIPAWRKKH
jgi:cell division protein FtsB